MKRRNIFIVALLGLLMVLLIFGLVRSFSVYHGVKELWYIILTGIAMVYLFKVQNQALAVLGLIPIFFWHKNSFAVLGWWKWGIQVILYWGLLLRRWGLAESLSVGEDEAWSHIPGAHYEYEVTEPYTLPVEKTVTDKDGKETKVIPNGIIYKLPVYIPLVGLRVSPSIKRREIYKEKTAYQLTTTWFNRISYPTDLPRCSNPDICAEETQWLGYAKMESYMEDTASYMHFYAPGEKALIIQRHMVYLITKACKDNDLKRVVAPRTTPGDGHHGSASSSSRASRRAERAARRKARRSK